MCDMCLVWRRQQSKKRRKQEREGGERIYTENFLIKKEETVFWMVYGRLWENLREGVVIIWMAFMGFLFMYEEFLSCIIILFVWK